VTKNNTSLRDLSVEVEHPQEVNEGIRDDWFSGMKRGLQKMKPLHHLSLDFTSCDITDEGVKYLKEGLKSLRPLTRLSLNLA